jgi:hypothetical protein
MNEGKKNCLSSGFHLTYISNQWSKLETTQEFVEHVPCRNEKFKWKNLPYWKSKRWFGLLIVG